MGGKSFSGSELSDAKFKAGDALGLNQVGQVSVMMDDGG